MGRPKANDDQKFKPLVTMKGPQKWIDWVEALSKKTDMSVTEMFDVALIEYAKGVAPELPHPGRKIPKREA